MLLEYLTGKDDRLAFFALAFTLAVSESRKGEIPVYTCPDGAQWRVSKWELDRLFLYVKITCDLSEGVPEGASPFIEDPRVLENLARRGGDPGLKLLEADSICVSVLRYLSSSSGASSAWGEPDRDPSKEAKSVSAREEILGNAVGLVVSGGEGLECRKYRRGSFSPAADAGHWKFSRESGRAVLLELVRLARREGALGRFERRVLGELAALLDAEPGLLERMEDVARMEDEALSLAAELVGGRVSGSPRPPLS
ncbi:MAG: hypothetical protein LBR80_02205 [Deltaproteobacteria bacterium]|jgi:hypothetical protein|nr:hypothetical protein [Deltaproteobacteria bacterium]